MAERTYAMIKPDAMASGSKAGILERIKSAGFTVVAEKELSLTKVWKYCCPMPHSVFYHMVHNHVSRYYEVQLSIIWYHIVPIRAFRTILYHGLRQPPYGTMWYDNMYVVWNQDIQLSAVWYQIPMGPYCACTLV